MGEATLRCSSLYTAPLMMLILLAKILATALCIGFGFSGGVFSPALLIGTLFGALAGFVSELIGLTPGTDFIPR